MRSSARVLFILLLAVCSTQAAPEDHIIGGTPVSDGKTVLRETTGFLVGFDPDTDNPEWVAYRLTGSPRFNPQKRPSRFSEDPLVRGEPSHDDYTHSGYDRGHLASNHVIGSYFGRKAQRESFLTTNIIPQTPGLNRGGVWRELERLEMGLGSAFGTAWVITGPVETSLANRLPAGVSLPEGCFKIYADQTGSGWRLAAFLFSQDSRGGTLHTYAVPVDRIEELTGINFFPDKPRQWEKIEASKGTLWIAGAEALRSTPSPTYKQAPIKKPSSSATAGYWISSTGKTHRDGCRYFGKGNGHYGPPSGDNCKICGGSR